MQNQTSQADTLANLRARLLQHIIQTRFKETFGANWWSNVLLRHMREESQTGTFTGKTYQIAFNTYGRQIVFQNLDTTVLSTIILFDQYFQRGNYQVVFSNYELVTVKQLHKLRNKIGHEENDVAQSEKAKTATMSLLRNAVDELKLIETNPELARDILMEYLKRSGTNTLQDTELQKFVEYSSKYERAESLFKWHIEEAIPLYTELAEKEYLPAIEKLLYIYTQIFERSDIHKAVEYAKKLEAVGKYSEDNRKRLERLETQVRMSMVGDLDGCRYVLQELKTKFFNSGKLQRFCTELLSSFTVSVPGLGIETHYSEIHGMSYDDLKALRDTDDPEAYAETAYRMIYQKNADFSKAWRCADKSSKLGSKRGAFLAGLLGLEYKNNTQVSGLTSVLADAGENGFLPAVEYFAEKGKDADDVNSSDPAVKWILYGKELGSSLCEDWYNGILERSRNAESTSAESAVPPTELDYIEKYETQLRNKDSEIEKLKKELNSRATTVRILGAATAVLAVFQIIQIFIK